MTSEERAAFGKMLTELENANFDAGEWDDEGADSPEYLAISDRCSHWRKAVTAELDRLTGYKP